MDFENVATMINTVGFPIVASGALFWLNVKVIGKLNHTMDNNTKALTELSKELRSQRK